MSCAWTGLYAIPADPQPKQVRQSDGTWLTVTLRGDEHAHLFLADDGTPLFYNGASHSFEYARIANNRIVGSGILARNAAERDAQAKAYVRQMDVQAFEQIATQQSATKMHRAPAARRILINNFPSRGTQKSLVVLIEFSDTPFSSIDDANQFYDDMLNKEGFTWSNGASGSARDFYRESSNGLFNPEFVVVGPVKLSHEATYYGSDDGGQDNHMPEAVIEACKAIDDDIDFADYDADGDGAVDNIYFFYAGGGQADDPNGTNYIWPHAAHLSTDWNKSLTLDGVRIDRYACSNELRYSSAGEKNPTGIGTFVHEFGHVLGLADHYDVSYGLLTFGLGAWDTMASGSYNNNMNTPPTFSAFERAELGWLQYLELTTEADSISTLPALPESNKAYRVSVAGTEGREFYVMENRQKRGWDKYLPGEGMLLWHIDIDTLAWENNSVNVQAAHQRIDIVEADQIATEATRSADTFPGTAGITSWQLTSWAGDNLLRLDDISERGDTIRLLPAGTTYVLPAPRAVTLSEVADSSFVMTWSQVENARRYNVSVFTTDSDGNRTYVDALNKKEFLTVDTIKVDALKPSTDYSIEVSASQGSYASAICTASVRTAELIFAKRLPTGLRIAEASATSFKAAWDEVPSADDYQVSLFDHVYSSSTTEQGYDFSEKYDGLPQLWNTSSQTYYSVKGYYGSSAPSLRLSAGGDYLVIAYPETKIESLNFWLRSSKAGNKIVVETAEDDDWQTLQTLDAPTEAQTVSLEIGGAKKVRLKLERTQGFVAIDDVVATGRCIERTPVSNFTNVSTEGKTSYTFTDLTTGHTYGFSVVGVKNGELSYRSAEQSVTLVAPAVTDTLNLGFCNGQIASSSSIQMNGKGWTECALRLPAASLSAYEGNSIVAVSAALVARINTDSLVVWVRRTLDGPNLAEATVVKNGTEGIVKGWNCISLDTPYSILANESDLFVGYSLHQKANVKAVSMVGEPMANTSYLKLGTADWENVSDLGVLSIEAVIAGQTMPHYDLGLNDVTISPQPTSGITSMQVSALVHNYGTRPVTGFTITCSADGLSPIATHIDQSVASTANAAITFSIAPEVETDENTIWTVEISSLDDASDERTGNNSAEATYTFLRNVLIEEFTTEKCTNCPRVAGYIHDVLSRSDFSGRINVVAHHAGYYTDAFTQPCDEDLIWLYASASSSYAPAVLIDRQPIFTSSSTQDEASTAFIPSSADNLAQYVEERLTDKANAIVGISLAWNADSTQVTANINCLKNDHYATAQPRLCLYLIENGIKSTTQSGATGVYSQEHVNRAYNSTWGQAVEWQDGKYAYTYTFDIEPSWVKANMEVIATLGNYDATNRLNCVIDNSASTPLISGGSTTSIDHLATDAAPHEVARYTIDGRIATKQARGVILVKMSDGSVKKIMVK